MNGNEFPEGFGPGGLVDRVIDGLLREGDLGSARRYAPDGLAGGALEELIGRAYAEVAEAPRHTSALLDGSAAEQRRRRMEHRALGAVIRVLPVRDGACGSDERRAA